MTINEAKLTGLWASNCDANKPVLILKFAFVPDKLPGLSRNVASWPVVFREQLSSVNNGAVE